MAYNQRTGRLEVYGVQRQLEQQQQTMAAIGVGVGTAVVGAGVSYGLSQLNQPNPQNYISSPQQSNEDRLLLLKGQMADQSAMFNNNLALTSEAIGANQALNQDALAAQSAQLEMESKMAPILPTFNAEQASQEAARLGLANLQRSREAEALTNPEAAKIRAAQGQQVADLTSSSFDKDWMNQLMKRGLISGAATGLDPTKSTLGANSFYTASSAQKRARDAENLNIQTQYLRDNPAPTGGLDPGALVTQEQNTVNNNASQLNNWIQSIMAGGGNLINGDISREGQTLQNIVGMEGNNNATIASVGNQNFQNLQGDINTNDQNTQQYQQMLYQNAAQRAQAQNAAIGSAISGAGSAIGSGITSGGLANFVGGGYNGGPAPMSSGFYKTQSDANVAATGDNGIMGSTNYAPGMGFYIGG